MTRSEAASRVLRELDDELASAAQRSGLPLVWSAQEREVLDTVARHIDRREDLQSAYENCGSNEVRTRVVLATELRLLEVSINRLLAQLKTEPPQPESQTTIKARAAVNRRWERERARNGRNPGA